MVYSLPGSLVYPSKYIIMCACMLFLAQIHDRVCTRVVSSPLVSLLLSSLTFTWACFICLESSSSLVWEVCFSVSVCLKYGSLIYVQRQITDDWNNSKREQVPSSWHTWIVLLLWLARLHFEGIQNKRTMLYYMAIFGIRRQMEVNNATVMALALPVA